ncbi:hypothetical protein BC830DRAFT_1112123 [Chytriomyces sp. MP71]|nr:hypothetical protein BC830DRAFT_1112123 [Chytriomyces sp. MP71]
MFGNSQFMIRNFTYTDKDSSTWFAGIGDDTDGVKFSPDAPTKSNGQDSGAFGLVKNAGSWYDWTVVTQVRLFEMTNSQLICVADLPVSSVQPTQVVSSTEVDGSTMPLGSIGSSRAASSAVASQVASIASTPNTQAGAATAPTPSESAKSGVKGLVGGAVEAGLVFALGLFM